MMFPTRDLSNPEKAATPEAAKKRSVSEKNVMTKKKAFHNLKPSVLRRRKKANGNPPKAQLQKRSACTGAAEYVGYRV
jgi:hypothetical protein